MPLLPGETRDSDHYKSGLSFIDEYAASVRRWADKTQISLDRAWQEYSQQVQHGLDDLRRPVTLDAPTQINARLTTQSLLAPVVIDWNDPSFFANAVFGTYHLFPYIQRHGDPLKRCPATILLIASNAVVFCNPQPIRKWCISPFYVVEQGQFQRLLTSSFIHQDINHFLNNMFSLLRSGYLLEWREGSWNHLATTLLLAAASNSVCVASAFIRAHFFGGGREAYFLPKTIGLSPACSALQVLAEDAAGSHPFKFWFFLAVNAVALRGDHLEAMLCGFGTGLAWVWGPRLGPLLQHWLNSTGPRSTWSGGRGGGYRLGSRSEESLRVGNYRAHPLVLHGMLAAAFAAASVALGALQQHAGRRFG